MATLEYIKEPVAQEILRYEEFLRSSLHSDNPLAGAMLDYIFENRGKAVRPILALLSASVFTGEHPLPERSLLTAMLVEMMHTASLVHDDVIDESDLRRGKPSVKAKWHSRLAVLIGDYILARSYAVGMHSGHYDIVRIMVDAMTGMCDGELIQSRHSGKFDMTREVYDMIIYRKTACLIGASSAGGAMSVGAGQRDVTKMREYGDALGMAFQIKDDMLDYQPFSTTGKTPCSDIREQKINLPLLLVLGQATTAERKHIQTLMARADEPEEAVTEICSFVTDNGGLELAGAEMAMHIDKAQKIVHTLPPTRYRDSLGALCEYIASRSY
ncbi:MAG: polyprenyl synthetase family protein [Rikenellaceae bacterium]|nr:polyprenyl synthetase family protein [Rikenellaceae bacterium]